MLLVPASAPTLVATLSASKARSICSTSPSSLTFPVKLATLVSVPAVSKKSTNKKAKATPINPAVNNALKSMLNACSGLGIAPATPLISEIPVTQAIILELEDKFKTVLDGLVIDTANDPNSQKTARRLSKMYINELMSGRYDPMPNATAFPNVTDDRYTGMLVVRSELVSMCSHHHQPVKGTAYIGIIAADTLIGLSKYTRIAQWCARRGTLQEELAMVIANEIQKATGSNDVGVYIQATHGCCENRGIMAKSSLTQTTVLKGAFNEDPGTKKEFMDNIKLQQEFARD